MIAEMTSYYSELQDHDGPPSRAMMNNISRTSIDRKSTTSELSLDLDDLEDMRLHRTPSYRRGPHDNATSTSSVSSSSSWAHEAEATTGNLNLFGGPSFGGFLQHSSLESVIEDGDEEFPSNSVIRTDPIGDNNIHRPRLFSDDNDTWLALHSSEGESPSKSCFGRSLSWDGKLPGSFSDVNMGEDDSKKCRQRVHFEVPARLENIQEFDKPDFEDFDKLYYMAHEIQKMMDDFRQESELDRHVVR
jgi:hypothetical protein